MGDVRYDRKAAHSLEVTLSIPNAIGVSLHLTVYSASMFGSKLLAADDDADATLGHWLHTDVVTRPMQSFAIVHVQKPAAPSTTETDRRRRYNAIGRRQPGDRLLYFRSLNVTNLARFAERDFQFAGTAEQAISYVGFAFDVRIYDQGNGGGGQPLNCYLFNWHYLLVADGRRLRQQLVRAGQRDGRHRVRPERAAFRRQHVGVRLRDCGAAAGRLQADSAHLSGGPSGVCRINAK